jgi:hypothetical protein
MATDQPSPVDADVTRDAFHQHLDTCARCRESCFNMCPVGNALLHAAGTAAADSLGRAAAGALGMPNLTKPRGHQP